MLERAKDIEEQLVAWRRDIHKHPELGFEETRTAARVAEELDALDYEVETGIGRTGVVGERGSGDPIVAVRADMDALPIEEENDVPYASQNPGVMHACGHDCHVAMLLGVAELLSEETFEGTVRLLFQPAEETEDAEGKSGAQRMIEDSALEGVTRVLALHVDASLPVGSIVVDEGVVNAGVDAFRGIIFGEGGHGAYPHTVVDPIHIAGHVVLGLHAIVSRRIRPSDPAVISIGSIHGGQAENVIPQRVNLSGTIRYLEPKVQETLHLEIARALGMAKSMGGSYDLRIDIGYPPMINDPGVVALIREVGADLLGIDHVRSEDPRMGAEDFAFYNALAPGAMFGLGCRIDGDERKPHNPRFDVDEACLPIGTALLAATTLRLLRG